MNEMRVRSAEQCEWLKHFSPIENLSVSIYHTLYKSLVYLTEHMHLSFYFSSAGTAGGGTGAVFDWSVAGQLNAPVILAGA